MHRLAESFDLPGDCGAFTNVGATLDTSTPLFGLGSLKYNAANVEYAVAPLLNRWASYFVWTGKHFKMANPASSTPNWLFGWRTEQTPGNIVEGGCVGVMNSKLCLALALLGGPTVISAVGRKTLLADQIYNLQAEIWHGASFGWVKLKINNRVIPDLVFNGVTALASEPYLSAVWVGSLHGGGNGLCWVDDFVLNDQRPDQNQDQGWPGMVIVQAVPVDGEGNYGEFTDDAGDQIVEEQLAEPIPEDAAGVSETPISCDNTLDATVPCLVAVEGPITNPTFENETSSEAVAITGVVPSGSRLVINTQLESAYLLTPGPGVTSITEDWSAFINPSPVWFQLTPGVNSINVSGAAGNVVTVGWTAYQIGPKDSFEFDPKPTAPTAPMGSAGLVAVDTVFRMQLTGGTEGVDKLIPGSRRASVDAWTTDFSGHLVPTDVLASHIDRGRRDRLTSTPWTPGNINSTETIFQYSNYASGEAQPSTPQTPAPTGQPTQPPQTSPPSTTPPTPAPQPPVTQPPAPDIVDDPPGPVEVANNTFVAALNGVDTANGTESSPVRTIWKLATLLNPGDRGIVRGGNWSVPDALGRSTGRIRTDGSSGTTPSLFRSGLSWSQPITIANYDGEVPKFRNLGITTSVRYLIFHGLLFDGENSDYESVYLHGSSYIRLRVCRITRGADQGVLIPHGYDIGHELIQCEIYNNGFGNHLRSMASHGPRFCHGAYLSGSNMIVDGCLIHDNSGYGLHNYNGYTSSNASDKSQNNIFRFNKVYSNGITLAPSDPAFAMLVCGYNSLAHHNLVYRNRGGMQMAYGGTPTNLAFYFNTVAFNGASPYLQILYGVNCKYRNNINFGNSGSLSRVGDPTSVIDHNLATDPDFVNSGASNFHLQSGSDAIGAGVAISGLTEDFDGVPHSNPPDVGAFEFV